MKLKQLKEECPKIPEDIRAMIEHEVQVQIMQADDEKYTKSNKFGRNSLKKSAAVILVATMAFGTTVFAGTKLYQWYTEKEGHYGLKAGIAAADSEKISIPEEIPVLKFEAKYLPAGMVGEEDKASSKYYYSETPYQGGISISSVAMDEELSADKLPVIDTNVTFFETLNINGLDGVYLEKHVDDSADDNSSLFFDKKIYLAYPDYWQILEVVVGEDVSKEEAVKMLQNLEVKPTGETMKLSDAYTWNDLLNAEEESVDARDEKRTATKEEMKNTHQIGEEFTVPSFAATEEEEGTETDCITAKVAKIQIADDLELLDEKFTDKELNRALGADGKLIKNKISYMESGDGIDTLDANVKTEEVNQKLVYATIEFTNTGEEKLKDVLFIASFLGLEETEEGYTIYDRAGNDNDEKTNFISCSSIGRFGEMDYFDLQGGEEKENYISSIEPGETVTVNVAKIVNEDEMDKMFLSLDGEGGYASFADSALRTGYVDIRQQ